MNRRRVLITTLILCVGTTLSLFAFLVADRANRVLGQYLFTRHAVRHVDQLIANISPKLDVIRELARDLAAYQYDQKRLIYKLPEGEFRRKADAIRDRMGFLSVEWCPFVEGRNRDEFEREMSQLLGRPFEISRLERKTGQLKRSNNQQRMFPVQYVSPTKYLASVAGLQRSNKLFPSAAANGKEPVLFGQRRFYPTSPRCRGICCPVRQPSDGGVDSYVVGCVVVMLPPDPFGVIAGNGRDKRVFVRVTDVTNSNTDLIATDVPSAPEVVKRRSSQPIQTAEVEQFFSSMVSFAGRRIRFDCLPNPDYSWQPPWLPWTALLIGLALTAASACRWTSQDAKELSLLSARQEIQQGKKLQQFLQTMLEYREQERELVAHEIHDGFVQEVVGAQMFVQAISARVSPGDDSSRRDLDMANQLLSKAIEEGRRMINDLKPSLVDELGLVGAVEHLVAEEQQQFDMSIIFRRSPKFHRLPTLVERTLYRIIQESLTNVRRHAGTNEATVSISQNERSVVLEIKDRGRGFDLSKVDDSRFGIRGIQERARLLQGHGTISSAPDEGTHVTVEIPIGGHPVAEAPHFQRRLTEKSVEDSTR